MDGIVHFLAPHGDAPLTVGLHPAIFTETLRLEAGKRLVVGNAHSLLSRHGRWSSTHRGYLAGPAVPRERRLTRRNTPEEPLSLLLLSFVNTCLIQVAATCKLFVGCVLWWTTGACELVRDQGDATAAILSQTNHIVRAAQIQQKREKQTNGSNMAVVTEVRVLWCSSPQHTFVFPPLSGSLNSRFFFFFFNAALLSVAGSHGWSSTPSRL